MLLVPKYLLLWGVFSSQPCQVRGSNPTSQPFTELRLGSFLSQVFWTRCPDRPTKLCLGLTTWPFPVKAHATKGTGRRQVLQ